MSDITQNQETASLVGAWERQVANAFQVAHCRLVNSHASAHRLTLAALSSPLLGERAIGRGDEVILLGADLADATVAVTQCGAVPVLVGAVCDGSITAALESALSPCTRAVMTACVFHDDGDLLAVRNFCNEYELWMIEDVGDGLGHRHEICGKHYYSGTVGDIGVGMLSAEAGGMTFTRDGMLAALLYDLREGEPSLTATKEQVTRNFSLLEECLSR